MIYAFGLVIILLLLSIEEDITKLRKQVLKKYRVVKRIRKG